MKIRNEKDFWAGLMFIAFGVGFAIIARNYQMGTAVRMGPAYFPTVLGGILAVLGLIVFVRAFFSNVDVEAARLKLPFTFLDLVVGVAVFSALAWVSKELVDNADWGMLAAAVVLPLLSILFRPETKALVLLLASNLAYAYLLKPLGLALASAVLIFVASYGGHEFKWKEVTILTVVLVLFSVLVFVKGLTLPFPIWPAFME